MTYESFIFKNWSYEPSTRQLRLHYGFDNAYSFTEVFTFDFEPVNVADSAQVNQAMQTLFLMAGVSYYKAFRSKNILIQTGILDDTGASFFAKTYQKGLGEYFFVNKLDPLTSIPFSATGIQVPPRSSGPLEGMLVGIGGGKDSLVSVEMLKDKGRVATWSLNHRTQLTPLIERIGLTHYQVDRVIDPQLLELNKQGALNGHVPISAILACAGTIVALLAGYRDVVVSNESTADEPNLVYQNVLINHQYSKSSEFERDYQAYLAHTLGDESRYYSLLRSYTELHITEIFAKNWFEKYHDVFSSCNRAFTHDSPGLYWCGECAKCAFVFLALTPFVDRNKLEALWNGKNLLLNPDLKPLYRQLLGIEGTKPLDCVGEIKETRAAMRLAQTIYPEQLKEFVFELPADYDYTTLAANFIPE